MKEGCGSGWRSRCANPRENRAVFRVGVLVACVLCASCETKPTSGSSVRPAPGPPAATTRLDGRIVFQSRSEGLWQIFLLDLRSGERRRISRSTADDTYPTFSPRGDWIAFESSRDGTPAVYRMRADGSATERLTRGDLPCHSPAWAPSGTVIAYDCARNGREDVYALDLVSGRERRITGGLWRNALPDWSADGSQIAFTRNELGWDVALMNADGSGVKNLTSRGGNCRPDWSPDGRRIAYVSDAADGKGDIWTMDPDGGNQVRLTLDSASYDYDPAWSPDGTWIVYQRTTDKKHGPWSICVLPAAGGEPVCLTPAGADDRFPDWSR